MNALKNGIVPIVQKLLSVHPCEFPTSTPSMNFIYNFIVLKLLRIATKLITSVNVGVELIPLII